MHELGIVIDIVKQVEEYKQENNIKNIKALVLQVGELSGVVPKYIEDVYPLAIERTTLSDMKLIIEETNSLSPEEFILQPVRKNRKSKKKQLKLKGNNQAVKKNNTKKRRLLIVDSSSTEEI